MYWSFIFRETFPVCLPISTSQIDAGVHPTYSKKKKQQKEQERCANTHTHRYSLLILAKVERSQFNRRHEHVSDGRPGRTKKKNRI